MKINFIIIFIFISLISNILSTTTGEPKHFKKNEKVKINAGDNVAIFESDSFNKGDKIYFKITSKKFNDNQIQFGFFDVYDFNGVADFIKILEDLDVDKTKDAEDVYSDWYGEGKTNFYTIKKDNLKNNAQGKLLGLYADSDNEIYFENYEKKDNNTVIIIVVVIVVVIIVGFLIFYCIKRKKRLAQMNNMNVYNGNNANVNNYPNQGNYGPQAYNQNQNYNNNMNTNMNMNMNQRPPQGPQGPYGNNNNMGYNNVPYANNPQQYSGIPQNSNPMRYG